MKTKKLKLKLYRLLGIKRCSTVNRKTKRQKLKEDPNYIYNNRGTKTYTPDCWITNTKLYKCQDGTVIPYGFEENFKNTAEALDKLAQDTIKGQSLNN